MSQKVPANTVRDYLPDGYRKKTAYLGEGAPGRVTVTSHWQGGSKDEFMLIRNGVRSDVGRSPGFPPVEQYIELQQGDVFVRHGTFMGKPSTASIEVVK